ncbi:MAG: CAP domain-containing protein [Actinomycetota bacterium]
MQSTLRVRAFSKSAIVAGLILAILAFAPAKSYASTTSSEKQLATLINKARASAGRAPLVLSGSLSKLARKHSAAMAAKGTIYHNPKLASWLSPYTWKVAGENVGMGGSILSIHNAFMASTGHRANNLSKAYKKVGVGVVWKGKYAYVTVIFLG